MKTDVYFAGKDDHLVIAYKNELNQNVFIEILGFGDAPNILNKFVCDYTYNIEYVMRNCYNYNDIQIKNMEIGFRYKNICKPFIDRDNQMSLDEVYYKYSAKRDLSMLVGRLQDILLYVEPSVVGFKTYSHKIRELLILACTELENTFKLYNFGQNVTTKDYVNILKFVNLYEYSVSLIGYRNKLEQFCPFKNWDVNDPSSSLAWYSAYNDCKHNKNEYFELATLENCINAVVANIIMFSIRFDAYELYNTNDTLANLMKNYLLLKFKSTNLDDFYIPILEGNRFYTYPFSRKINFPNGKIMDIYADVIHKSFEIKELKC